MNDLHFLAIIASRRHFQLLRSVAAEGVWQLSVLLSQPLGLPVRFMQHWMANLGFRPNNAIEVGSLRMISSVERSRETFDSPTIWPVGLLDGDVPSTSREERSWWLIYAQSRQEKMIARSLFAKRVPFYLPLVERKSRSRGRTRSAMVPLFTGYVFLYGDPEERVQALTTNRVSTTSLVAEGDRLRKDLSKVSQLISMGAPLTPEARIEPGDWVRVKAGPFAGFEGTVMKRRGATRLLVAVTYLQQGVSMEIDDFLLEAV